VASRLFSCERQRGTGSAKTTRRTKFPAALTGTGIRVSLPHRIQVRPDVLPKGGSLSTGRDGVRAGLIRKGPPSAHDEDVLAVKISRSARSVRLANRSKHEFVRPAAPTKKVAPKEAVVQSSDRRGRLAGISAKVALGALAIVLLWAYWPVLVEMARRWGSDPQYSHAYLVPLFSLYLLWSSRGSTDAAAGDSSWWGLPLLIVGIGMFLAGAYWYFDWLSAVSLLPVLLGTALLLGGWPTLRRAGWAIGFLGFMIPLPYRIETALSQPLQRVATIASTYALQTFGLPAIAEGNVIVINDARIGVVEACNGLGMLLLFVAMAAAVALVVRRSLVEKAVIVASAIPTALVANIVRITLAGSLAATVGSQWAERVFHDLAGWLMMPFALGLLWLELQCLSRMFLDVECRPIRLQLGGEGVTTGNSNQNARSAPRIQATPLTRQAGAIPDVQSSSPSGANG
jgi:exosortase